MTADEFRRVLAALDMSTEDLRRLANTVRTDGRTMPWSTVCNMAAGRSGVGAWCQLALHLLCRERGIDMATLLATPAAAPPTAAARRADRAAARKAARDRTIEAIRGLMAGRPGQLR